MYIYIYLYIYQIGVYEVMQPDGKQRVVRYKANDEKGFLANVSYTVKGPRGEDNTVYQTR